MDIQIGMKFQMGTLFYSVMNINEAQIKCTQLDEMMDDTFPTEIVLQNKQLEHVTILTDDEYAAIKQAVCYLIL